jgi:hypothetical protein
MTRLKQPDPKIDASIQSLCQAETDEESNKNYPYNQSYLNKRTSNRKVPFSSGEENPNHSQTLERP